MRLRTILGAIAVLVVLLLVGGILYVRSIDVNQYRGFIAQKVKEATGRELVLAGPISLELGWSPSLVMERASFANAPWGSRKEMVKLERLEVQVELLPLLSRELRLQRLILIGPDILLETDRSGRGNWEMGAPKEKGAPKESGGGGVPAILGLRALMKNGRLAYRDGKTGVRHELQFEQISLDGKSLDAPLTVQVKGRFNATPLTLEGKVGPVRALFESGKKFFVDLDANAVGLAVNVKGNLSSDSAKNPQVDLKLSVKGKSLADLKPWIGPEFAGFGPIALSAAVKGGLKDFRLQGIALDLRAAGLDVKMSGSAAGPVESPQADLELSVKGASLAGARAWVGPGLARVGPVSLSAAVKGGPKNLQVRLLGLTVGKSDLAGEVGLRLAGRVPSVAANLQSKRFDLADVLPEEEGKKEKGKKKESASARPAKRKGKVFPDNPLPLDGLRGVNAEVTYSGKEILGAGPILRDVRVTLSLNNGLLSVKSLEAALAGGKASGGFSLDARSGRIPAMRVKFQVRKLLLERLMKDMKMTPMVEGAADFGVDLQGQGPHVAAIMGSLNGDTKFLMGKGKASTKGLNVIVGGVTQILGTLFSKSADLAGINCIANNFSIKNGVATSQVMVVDAEFSTIVGKGSIDLGRERLDLLISPKAKSATLNLAVPIKVQGTLARPKIRPDEAAVLRKIGGLVGLFVFPPAAVVGLGEFGAGEENSCLKLASSQGKAPAAGATRKSAPGGDVTREVEKSLKKGLKGFGKGLKGLFGR